jgi:mannosyltransferase
LSTDVAGATPIPTKKAVAERYSWIMSPSVLILLACVAGTALRLLLLGSKSMWLDEVRGLEVARQGMSRLLLGQSEAYHPPLFYVLITPWISRVESPFLLRLPAAIIDVLSLPLLYHLTRRLANRRSALTSLWLAAFSPLLIWYAQEFRSYSLLVFLALLATLTLVEGLERPKLLAWLLFVGVMIAAFYLHYDALLLLPLQALLIIVLIAGGRIKGRGALIWFAGLAATALGYWPWLRTPGAALFLQILISDRNYPARLIERTLGISYASLLPFLAIGAALLATGGALVLWTGLRRSQARIATLRTTPGIRALSLTFFVILLIGSVVPQGYTVKRHLLIAVPAVLMVLAWIWPWERSNRATLIVLLTMSLVASTINIVFVPKPQWDQVAQLVLDSPYPREAVIISPTYMSDPFNFYARGRIPLLRVHDPDPAAFLANASSTYDYIWLVWHTADIGANLDQIQVWLNQHGQFVRSQSFYRIQVDLYQLP